VVRREAPPGRRWRDAAPRALALRARVRAGAVVVWPCASPGSQVIARWARSRVPALGGAAAAPGPRAARSSRSAGRTRHGSRRVQTPGASGIATVRRLRHAPGPPPSRCRRTTQRPARAPGRSARRRLAAVQRLFDATRRAQRARGGAQLRAGRPGTGPARSQSGPQRPAVRVWRLRGRGRAGRVLVQRQKGPRQAERATGPLPPGAGDRPKGFPSGGEHVFGKL
jgi:hypothetical protein